MSTDSRSIKIAFAMSVIAKVGEFLNTLTMQYELRYKWWINAVVMILSVPHCLCWSFYFQNIITFLFEKLSCAVEIFIWSDAVDFLIKLLGMPYSVVTAQQACSTEMVKYIFTPTLVHLGHLRLLIAHVTLRAKRSSKQRASQLMKRAFTTNICYRR